MKCYGHFFRMEDSRWPKKIYQWTPHGRRTRGRPQQSWKNQVTDFSRTRNMEEYTAEDKTSLAFGSGWMALGCIDPNSNKICSCHDLIADPRIIFFCLTSQANALWRKLLQNTQRNTDRIARLTHVFHHYILFLRQHRALWAQESDEVMFTLTTRPQKRRSASSNLLKVKKCEIMTNRSDFFHQNS